MEHLLNQLHGGIFIPRNIREELESVEISEKPVKTTTGTCNLFNGSTQGCPMSFRCIPAGKSETCSGCGKVVTAPRKVYY